MKWYLHDLRKYAVFKGRASRREYWVFEITNYAISIGLFVLAVVLAKVGFTYFIFVAVLYAVATIPPSLSSLIRRLHDTGRSGWWFWIGLIPLFGPISMLVFTLEEGQPGENRYGPNPKLQSGTELTGTPEMGYLAPPIDRR